MTIKNINNSNLPGKEIKKTDRTDPAKAGNSGKETSASSVNSNSSDKVSLSQSSFDNELHFAKNLFDKLHKDSFSTLRQVKKKIARGEYNTEKVHQEISKGIENDLTTLKDLLKPEISDNSGKKKLSAEYRNYLIENPKVIKKVADSISEDLKKI